MFTASFMNWCEYFCRKCCQRQIWSCISTRCYLPGTCSSAFCIQSARQRSKYSLYPAQAEVVKTRRLDQQNLIHLFLLHTLIISSLSVRVLNRVIVHPHSGPNAESSHRLASLLNAYGSLPSVCHVETNALVLANLRNLEFGCF